MKLSNKIALTAAALVALTLVVTSGFSYLKSREQLIETAQKSLDESGRIYATAVGGRLNSVVRIFEGVAATPIVYNGLIDSSGLETYIDPFFASFRTSAGIPVDIALLQFQGNIVTGTFREELTGPARTWLNAQIQKGQNSAAVIGEGDTRQMLLAYMLTYPRTQSVEGVVFVRFTLADLLASVQSQLAGDEAVRISLSTGVKTPAPQNIPRLRLPPSLMTDVPISVQPMLAGVGLAVSAETSTHALRAGLADLAQTYLAIGALAILAVLLAGYFAGRRLTEPARRLQTLASSVVSAGSLGRRYVATGKDEMNEVGIAFNQMLDRLETSTGRLRVLLQSLSDVIVIVTADGERIPVLADGGQDGSAQDIPLPAAELVLSHTQAAIRTGTRQHLGYSLIGDKKSNTLYYDADIIPLSEDFPGMRSAMWIVHDVTETRKSEEYLRQAQKMDAVGQLTGGIAHDFNNLLAVILGNCEILALETEGRGAKELTAIERAGRRGAELTSRLLAFSRRQPLQPQAVDPNELIHDLDTIFSRTFAESIEIRVNENRATKSIVVDPGQLENAILNLAINARDAMPDGGTITITTGDLRLDDAERAASLELPCGDYVYVSVSDVGTGIPEDVLPHIFEPFFTTKDVGQGSGLGLSMVYGFAKQSSGGVEVKSQVGEGTTVTMIFPASERLATGGEVKSSVAVPRGKGETVMIVEDDAELRSFLIKALGRLGYKVIVAKDSQSAMTNLEWRGTPDVILCDVVLPGGKNGPQFIAELRKAWQQPVRVVFMSGYPLHVVSREMAELQATHFLSKPFTSDSLAHALHAALAQAGGGSRLVS
jgi:signal transduction histidine kinase/ActR/RegA family two-component response regulator/HAMP domain-containing protein